jgi:protein SHQ1
MPITPRFKISQTDAQIIIAIHIPHIRVSASTLDILVDGSDFHFHSSPYLLYLSFPGRLLDDAETLREAKASYDPSNQNGVVTVTIFKADEGFWKDLDLLGNLMNRNGPVPASDGIPREKIQVLASSDHGNETALGEQQCTDDNNEGDFPEDITACLKPHYGFLNMHHSVFSAYAREGLATDMLEIPDPDETSPEDRRELRLESEAAMFEPERYLGDLYLTSEGNDEDADMIFIEAFRMDTHWEKDASVDDLAKGMEQLETKDEGVASKDTAQASPDFFNDDERQRLVENNAKIPALSKISPLQEESLLLSLVDILYAYAYDHRTTFGDSTCESSWTIVMLSPTLSWFESYTPPYDNISSAFRWSIRRALIYPYLRNFDFVARKLVKDVAMILSAGKRVVLRCLLQIQKTLDSSEFHYLFNKLYISPYISWIQMINDEDLASFASQVEKCVTDGDSTLSKSSLGLDLEMLEKKAFECGEGENESESGSDDSSSSDSDSSSDDDSGGSEDESTAGSHEVKVRSSINLLDDQIGNGGLLSIATKTTSDKAKNEPKSDDVQSDSYEKKISLITEL